MEKWEARLEKSEARLEKSEARTAKSEARMDRIEKRLDGVTKILSQGMKLLVKFQTETNTKIDALVDGQLRLQDSVGKLERAQMTTEQKFQQLPMEPAWWCGWRLTSLRALAHIRSLRPPPWGAVTRPRLPTGKRTSGERNWPSSNPSPSTALPLLAKALLSPAAGCAILLR